MSFGKNTAPLQQAAPADNTGRKVVIAVDGPAASGKGTLARALAARLGYAYLDTGALYRAVGLVALQLGCNLDDINSLVPALEMVRRNLTAESLADPALRQPSVSEAASRVAALPGVRTALVDYQRAFAQNPPGNVGGAVLDGRDIGTVICPEADLKFFVTADPEERARRRFNEIRNAHPDMTEERVLRDILKRDQRDSTRRTAPTLAAPDATVIDSTKLPPEDVLNTAISAVTAKFLAETNA